MNSLDQIEITLLLEGVFQRSGYDFRNYAPASLKRRIWECVRAEQLQTIADLLARVLHDPECLERFLLALSVNVTAMFRDPEFYVAFRRRVVPLLRTYPFLRLWVAGCATGEEAYSLAILLQEAGLYERAKIYANRRRLFVLSAFSVVELLRLVSSCLVLSMLSVASVVKIFPMNAKVILLIAAPPGGGGA